MRPCLHSAKLALSQCTLGKLVTAYSCSKFFHISSTVSTNSLFDLNFGSITFNTHEHIMEFTISHAYNSLVSSLSLAIGQVSSRLLNKEQLFLDLRAILTTLSQRSQFLPSKITAVIKTSSPFEGHTQYEKGFLITNFLPNMIARRV